MRELAVQAANDTNTADDRTAIQDEVDELIEEINRIATTTQFNGQNLIRCTDGTLVMVLLLSKLVLIMTKQLTLIC